MPRDSGGKHTINVTHSELTRAGLNSNISIISKDMDAFLVLF